MSATAEHHATLSPSSLPALALCPQYKSGPAGPAAERGTLQHDYLEQLLTSPMRDKCLGLTPDERDGVEWAAEYIQTNKSAAVDLHTERRVTLFNEDFEEVTFGRLDAFAAPDLFDFKSGEERNYREQMAAYAWAAMDEFSLERVQVHELYGRFKKANTYWLTYAEAKALVAPVVERAGKGDPNPCDYCGWCEKAATCPALVQRAKAVEAGREDWEPSNWHSTLLDHPAEMAKALKLARQLKGWVDAVEHAARDMVFKDGKPLPGFKAVERQGNREVADLHAAFGLAGLPQDQFLKCCKVALGQLEEQYAEFRGMKKAPAARELGEKLANVIKRGKASQFLMAEKG